MSVRLMRRPFRHPFGRPLRRADLPHQVLAKKYALPVFASDALSSVAYATEEILKVLALAGVAYFSDSIWIAGIITVLLVVLLFSYRQTIFAYPNGGGAYIVARDNLGEGIAQVAGCALLIDYVLTVSVSVAAGVANFASGVHQFFPGAPAWDAPARTVVSLVVLCFMWYMNKRGVKESGRAFAVPTYFFLASMFAMLGAGFVKYLTGTLHSVDPGTVSGIVKADRSLTLFLLLRAFASGSAAVTGVEAISNGITAFKEPKSRNAATTMAWMCALLGVMFLGITKLALATHAQASTSETVISQLGRTVFSSTSPLYVAVIFGTAAILVMAANTSFADFPRLAALHAGDGFLPRWLTDRDNRLVYGIGISVLSLASGLLIAVFHADVDLLIPLYAIGVFLSFTISQAGMVVRWEKTAKLRPGEEVPSYSPEGVLVTTLRHDRHWRLKQALNGFGCAMTATVTVIFGFAKFSEGAWIVIVLVPVLTFIFFRIHHHYKAVKDELAVAPEEADKFLNLPSRKLMLLAVNDLSRHTLPALRDVLQAGGSGLVRQAIHVETNEHDAADLAHQWEEQHLEERGVPLVVLPSAFGGGDVVGDLVSYVRGVLAADPEIRVDVLIPEWSSGGSLWTWLAARGLHHLTGSRLKLAFLGQSRVTVTNHRYVLRKAA
ncbi:MAG TPA: APC family permease [Dehalococcoidia bacterium]|nr:APC family permease [Dehalococcoidia bacterium]